MGRETATMDPMKHSLVAIIHPAIRTYLFDAATELASMEVSNAMVKFNVQTDPTNRNELV